MRRQAARYVWALLLARIYEVLPLTCPKCGGAMKIAGRRKSAWREKAPYRRT